MIDLISSRFSWWMHMNALLWERLIFEKISEQHVSGKIQWLPFCSKYSWNPDFVTQTPLAPVAFAAASGSVSWCEHAPSATSFAPEWPSIWQGFPRFLKSPQTWITVKSFGETKIIHRCSWSKHVQTGKTWKNKCPCRPTVRPQVCTFGQVVSVHPHPRGNLEPGGLSKSHKPWKPCVTVSLTNYPP